MSLPQCLRDRLENDYFSCAVGEGGGMSPSSSVALGMSFSQGGGDLITKPGLQGLIRHLSQHSFSLLVGHFTQAPHPWGETHRRKLRKDPAGGRGLTHRDQTSAENFFPERNAKCTGVHG